jgi:cell division protein FtsI/penicillin-binding protein 2
MMSALANGGSILKPKVVLDGASPQVLRQLFMPDRIREYLWEGMRRVVSGKMGTARSSGVRSFGPGTLERKLINRMVPYMIGKTSTAEFVESFGITPVKTSQKLSHIWFAGIVFDEPLYTTQAPEKVSFQGKRPELVIVVCLHYGRFGKEAFPIAALLAQKWKEIQKRLGDAVTIEDKPGEK